MIGPSQTGKTSWILDFITSFSYINPGHILTDVLFLHMVDVDIPTRYFRDLKTNIKFHKIKSHMIDENFADNEIITEIDNFKKKLGDRKDNEHSLVLEDTMLAVGTRKKILNYIQEIVT